MSACQSPHSEYFRLKFQVDTWHVSAVSYGAKRKTSEAPQPAAKSRKTEHSAAPGGKKRRVEVPAEFGATWKRAVKPSDFCRNEHAPLKRVYRAGLCYKCFKAQPGSESKTSFCYLCGPSKPSRVQCPSSNRQFCKACAHDMCPEALADAGASGEESKPADGKTFLRISQEIV